MIGERDRRMIKSMDKVEGFYGAAEAATVLGMTRQAVYAAINAGTLKPDKHNPSRFKRSTLEKYRTDRLEDLKKQVAKLEQVIRST